MDSLTIEETNYTPKVDFNLDSHEFEIAGNSFPENSKKFYEPVIDWLQQYVEEPSSNTRVTFRLEYISSSSLKNVLNMLKILKKIHGKGLGLEINWFYDEDDDDILDAGVKLSNITDLEFKLEAFSE